MKKEEKRRKFHDSLLQMLYPPTSPPAPPQEHHQTPIINISFESSQHDHATNGDDDNDDFLSSDGDKSGEEHKLTRAQRKRLRKKKLRQAESQRRPIIGPLLPTTSDAENAPISEAEQQSVTTNDPQLVRQIAAVESIDNCDEQGASSNQNKIKQRRMAKKLVRDLKEQKDSSH